MNTQMTTPSFHVYQKISRHIATAVQPTRDRFHDLPIELQYRCALFFPRSVLLLAFSNTSGTMLKVDKDEQQICFNMAYLLQYLQKYPMVVDNDDYIWGNLCLERFGKDFFCIDYKIFRRQIVEKRHSEEWNEFYGDFYCHSLSVFITYPKPSYWTFSFVNHFVSRHVPVEHEYLNYGYIDYNDNYW